ncbi:hypothetical protein F443_14546 [Phytophthora nicotianae P1569]|nr:hypothetical protein F443_14546 [Phytophthora nicotianae P1569]ETO68626.1 hypothetical protein F444_14556 [Phytophthora nicotianae P1976]
MFTATGEGLQDDAQHCTLQPEWYALSRRTINFVKLLSFALSLWKEVDDDCKATTDAATVEQQASLPKAKT